MHALDPLHPAVVHFPIAFIILGTLTALCSLFFWRKRLTIFTVILLFLGAVGGFFAVKTGGEAYDVFIKAYPHLEETLNHHADEGNFAHKVAFAAAGLAIASVLSLRWSVTSKLLMIATTLIGLTTCGLIFETATLGGNMVHHEALGLNTHSIPKNADFSTLVAAGDDIPADLKPQPDAHELDQ